MVRKLSWDEIEGYVNKLAFMMRGNLPEDAVLIAIMRGGAIPMVLLSDKLGIKETGAVWIESYDGVTKGEIRFKGMTSFDGTPVFIDDIADTGATIEYVQKVLGGFTAILVKRPSCAIQPDFCALEINDWVEFPWCRKDSEGKGELICEFVEDCKYPWKNKDRCNNSLRSFNCSIYEKFALKAGREIIITKVK